MRKTKINIIASFLLMFLFLFPLVSLGNSGSGPVTSGDDIIRILENILGFLATMFFIVTAIFFLLAGFTYVTANGEPSKIEKATKMIKFGVIGVVVALLATSVRPIIESIIGS